MLVKIKFIRHSCSYGNVISHLGGIYSILHKFYNDPPLSQFGKNTCQEISRKISLHDVDFVFSSLLLRAIETGLYMFPDKKIYPIPFVMESSIGFDNCVSSVQNHRNILTDKHNRVVYDFVSNNNNNNNNNNNFTFTVESNLSNFENFLKWFIEILPNLIQQKYTKENDNPDKHISIAIITHSYFMYNNLNILKKYPKNNAIVEQIYDMSNDKLTFISSDLIFEGSDFPTFEQFNNQEKGKNLEKNNFFWNIMFGSNNDVVDCVVNNVFITE
jgi:hypothetical protein